MLETSKHLQDHDHILCRNVHPLIWQYNRYQSVINRWVLRLHFSIIGNLLSSMHKFRTSLLESIVLQHHHCLWSGAWTFDLLHHTFPSKYLAGELKGSKKFIEWLISLIWLSYFGTILIILKTIVHLKLSTNTMCNFIYYHTYIPHNCFQLIHTSKLITIWPQYQTRPINRKGWYLKI